MARPPGDSSEQQAAESLIVGAVSQLVGVELGPERLTLASGSWMMLDGVAFAPPVFCEAWAHVGKAKPGQQKKVMTDALKLVVARASVSVGEDCRAILAFCDQEAASHFQGQSWMAEALRQLEVEVVVVDIPRAVREGVLRAQVRQRR